MLFRSNDTATTEIYTGIHTLSLHDALPISCGAIENLELWRALEQSLALHETQLAWVRGHNGHPKNEYANDLAVRAAREQETAPGIVASGFFEWLAAKRAAGQYLDYDPDAAFAGLEERLGRGERLPLDLDATSPRGG